MGGGLDTNSVIEGTDTDASLTIKTTGADTTSSIVFEIVDTTPNNDESRHWRIGTEADSHNELTVTTEWLGVKQYPIRCFASGEVSFSGATSTSNFSAIFQKDVLIKEGLTLWDDLDLSVWNKNVDCGTGSVICDELLLGGVSVTNVPAPPKLVHNQVHMNPGGYTSWPILNDVTCVVHDTNQSSRFRLAEFPIDGQQLTILTCAPSGTGGLNIHTGAFNGRTFHPNSTGIASTVQCNLVAVGANKFHCVYILSTDEWLLV